jgi:hemoglobin-like flavoprotein
MTCDQIALVQNSWRRVVPISNITAELFYKELFRLDPSLKALFRGDMREQGRKLVAMISTAVSDLTRVESIVPAVRELGRRHAGYGVKPQHYDTVAAALFWTLAQGLGDGFTPEVKAAWAEAYGLLANTMKDAAAAA